MGFLDKVKSSVNDMGKAVNNVIDNEKADMKIREERRNLDQAAKEIGHAVAGCIMEGRDFDETTISEPMARYVEAKQKIAELEAGKGVSEESYEEPAAPAALPESSEEQTVTEDEPEKEVIQEQPEEAPQTVAEPESASAEATAAEGDSWKQVDENGWVDVKDEIFWTEDEAQPPAAQPAVREETQPAAQKAAEEPAPARDQEVADDSPLNRIKSYKSSNYSGDKL